MEKIWKGKKEKKNNKYNVLLESFLLKKVKIEDVHFFSNNNNLDTDLNEKVGILNYLSNNFYHNQLMINLNLLIIKILIRILFF